MAVVTKITKGVRDVSRANPQPNSHEAQANLKLALFEIAVANGDSSTSKFVLAQIPSHAILVPELCNVNSGGVAGLTNLSLGIDNGLGTVIANKLMSAVDVATAGNYSAVSALARTDYTKRLWQLLDLASDPGQQLTIYATTGANATGAGTLTGRIGYTVPGL